MFVAWALPAVGPALYIIFGIDRVHDKGFKKQTADQRLLAHRKARESETLPLAYWRRLRESLAAEPETPLAHQLNRTMDAIIPDFPLLGGNSIEPLVDGSEAFPALQAAIEGAKHHIHVQSFIIKNDRVGNRFLDLLAEKARAGVKVRVLFDRFGSTRAFLTRAFRKYAHIPNMQVVGWTQANPLKRQFQVNLRNHRKNLIVDGREAFFGGLNLQDHDLPEDARTTIRDYHFHVHGPLVPEIQYTFMRDWYFMTDESPEELLTESYFPVVEKAGNAKLRLINSGPASEMEVIADVFFSAIASARKQILAVTPYFVPPRDIVRALRSAALRGVEVHLLVPEKNNHFYAGFASKALYEELLDSCVRIFERPPPFMHSKAMIIDDELAIVGTSNLDVRSLRLNYETDVAVYDDPFVNRLKEIVLSDFSESREIYYADWVRRSVKQRIMENMAYLMMPIL